MILSHSTFAPLFHVVEAADRHLLTAKKSHRNLQLSLVPLVGQLAMLADMGPNSRNTIAAKWKLPISKIRLI